MKSVFIYDPLYCWVCVHKLFRFGPFFAAIGNFVVRVIRKSWTFLGHKDFEMKRTSEVQQRKRLKLKRDTWRKKGEAEHRKCGTQFHVMNWLPCVSTISSPPLASSEWTFASLFTCYILTAVETKGASLEKVQRTLESLIKKNNKLFFFCWKLQFLRKTHFSHRHSLSSRRKLELFTSEGEQWRK